MYKLNLEKQVLNFFAIVGVFLFHWGRKAPTDFLLIAVAKYIVAVAVKMYLEFRGAVSSYQS